MTEWLEGKLAVLSDTRDCIGRALSNKNLIAEDNDIARPEEMRIKYRSYFFFLIIDMSESIVIIISEFVGFVIFVKNIDIFFSRLLLPTNIILPILESILFKKDEFRSVRVEITRKSMIKVIKVDIIFFI